MNTIKADIIAALDKLICKERTDEVAYDTNHLWANYIA